MGRVLDFFAGVPATLLAHPWWTLLGAVVAGAAYLGLMVGVWHLEDRRDRERAARRYR